MDSSSLEELYTTLMGDVQEIDAIFDSMSDAKSAVRKNFIATLLEENATYLAIVIPEIVAALNNAPDERTRFALFFGIDQALGKEYGQSARTWLDANLPKVEATEAEKIGEDQAKELREKRSSIYKQLKMVTTLLVDTMGLPEDKFPMPKKGSGGRGTKRSSYFTNFEWTLDGIPLLPEADDVIKTWVETTKVYTNVREIRAAMTAAEINLKDPKLAKIELTTPLGLLIGTRVTESDEVDSDEDDEENDEENSEKMEMSV